MQCEKGLHTIIAGDNFWYITEEISESGGEVGSRRAGQVSVPETEWDYKVGGTWLEDDHTLTITRTN